MQIDNVNVAPPARDRVQNRLLGLAKGSRFEGGIYVRGATPIAATDGAALVVLGAANVNDARYLMVDAMPTLPTLPPSSSIDTVLRSAAKALAKGPSEGTTVSLDTVPDAGLLQAANAEQAAKAAAAEDAVERCSRVLTRALETRSGIGDARKDLMRAKARLRAVARGDGNPGTTGIKVGPAAVDLRLIRKCLRALGAKGGTIQSTGDWSDACVLYTDKGIALIMPFRTSPR